MLNRPANHTHSLVQQDSGSEPEEDYGDQQFEDPKSVKLQEHGSSFLIVFCACLIAYYLISSVISWFAYREWKGVAEDIAGGSVTMTTFGNVLHYAIIDKREGDAIADREAKRNRLEELKKQEEDRLAAGQADNLNNEDNNLNDGNDAAGEQEGGEEDEESLLQ